MLMTPISRVDVIGGYTIGYGILAALQSVVIILYSAYVLSIHIEGSVGLSILVMILMAFSAVSIGALVSIFANNELQLVQFIPVVVIPQIFFCANLLWLHRPAEDYDPGQGTCRDLALATWFLCLHIDPI
jgi:ABC-2 type transport system permease protein